MWLTWWVATGRALYGEQGFYRRERPSAHYRTAAHASPRYAATLVRLLEAVDADLGRPARLDLVHQAVGGVLQRRAWVLCCSASRRRPRSGSSGATARRT